MRTHRLYGIALAVLGLALLFGQLAMLYRVVGGLDVMVAVGLPGTAILTSLGAISFASGCLLAAAPRATVRHAGRVAGSLRRR